jgi:hypothetical protein
MLQINSKLHSTYKFLFEINKNSTPNSYNLPKYFQILRTYYKMLFKILTTTLNFSFKLLEFTLNFT